MFTGLVVDQGKVRRARDSKGVLKLEIEAPAIARALDIGDSVSVNGVCLTATTTSRRRFETDVMEETLARSTLGSLGRGDQVNLELPARLNDRLGGHLVQGHVDGIAEVTRIQDETGLPTTTDARKEGRKPRLDGMRRAWLHTGDSLLHYVVDKGSITLDGVSLTVAEVGLTTFQVALIPHTLKVTTLGDLRPGTKVNVEVDVIAKYVERLMERK